MDKSRNEVTPHISIRIFFYHLYSQVSEEKNLLFSAIPEASELNMCYKHASLSLKCSSAPGFEGFSGVLFTAFWDIVGESVVAAVRNFFTSEKLIKAPASFLLELIPKSPTPPLLVITD